MWFSRETDCAALAESAFATHSYAGMESDADVYWWGRLPGSQSESRHKSIKFLDPIYGDQALRCSTRQLSHTRDFTSVMFTRGHWRKHCVCGQQSLSMTSSFPKIGFLSVKLLRLQNSFKKKHPGKCWERICPFMFLPLFQKSITKKLKAKSNCR